MLETYVTEAYANVYVNIKSKTDKKNTKNIIQQVKCFDRLFHNKILWISYLLT